MTSKHDLPGGWVLLRDPEEVTERGRRKIRSIMFDMASMPGMETIVGLAGADSAVPDKEKIAAAVEANSDAIVAQMGPALGLIDALQDASILARVKEWSFTTEDGHPLPVEAESLLDLPGTAYDILKDLCKDLPVGLDTSPSPDPKARTSSSTG